MSDRARQLYLDLLKKSLSFTLWPELPVPIEMFAFATTPRRRWLINLVSRILKDYKLQLTQFRDISERERIEGRIWPGHAYTMIGMKRLDNLQQCIESVLADKVEGDLIETGVWRGGLAY